MNAEETLRASLKKTGGEDLEFDYPKLFSSIIEVMEEYSQQQNTVSDEEIDLKTLHTAARSMKWYDFQGWVAKRLFKRPQTEDTNHLTDNLRIKGQLNNNNRDEEITEAR